MTMAGGDIPYIERLWDGYGIPVWMDHEFVLHYRIYPARSTAYGSRGLCVQLLLRAGTWDLYGHGVMAGRGSMGTEVIADQEKIWADRRSKAL